ncbi:11794_t:CDS:2, partial [Dentiscutata erythropus]
MDDYDYNEANTDNYDYNEDNTISPDDSASAIVRSDISESIVTDLTSLQKYTSPVWKHYSLMTNEQKAICKYCKSKFSHKKGTRISHLRRHLKACRRYQASNGDSSNPPNPSDGQTQLDFSIFVTQPSKDLCHKNILQTITLDNTGSNNVAIHELVDYISQDSLININEELFHNRCFAHILNLIIRNCVKAIHSTPRQRQAYLDICEYESENPIIPSLDYHDRTFPDLPEENEWTKADNICTILNPFYDYTLKASANSYSTLNNIFASILNICIHLLNMRYHTDNFICDISGPMMEKFNKYWDDKKLESNDLNEKMQDIKKKFKTIYLQTYYSPLAIKRSTCHEAISVEDDTLMLEDHI